MQNKISNYTDLLSSRSLINIIHLILIESNWHADFVGDVVIHDLFGTTLLITPFSDALFFDQVKAKLQLLNFGCAIKQGKLPCR